MARCLRSTSQALVPHPAASHVWGMHLACPACAAQYEVPDAVLGTARRAMRCARCQAVWTPEAVPQEAAPAPAIMAPEPPPAWSDPADMDERLLPPDRRTSAGLGITWFVTIVVILGVAIGAVTQRDAVMAAWPPSAHAFAVMGLR